MSGPKPDALPLGDTPLRNFIYHSMDIWVGVKGAGNIKWLALLEGCREGGVGSVGSVGGHVDLHIEIGCIYADRSLL